MLLNVCEVYVYMCICVWLGVSKRFVHDNFLGKVVASLIVYVIEIVIRSDFGCWQSSATHQYSVNSFVKKV